MLAATRREAAPAVGLGDRAVADVQPRVLGLVPREHRPITGCAGPVKQAWPARSLTRMPNARRASTAAARSPRRRWGPVRRIFGRLGHALDPVRLRRHQGNRAWWRASPSRSAARFARAVPVQTGQEGSTQFQGEVPAPSMRSHVHDSTHGRAGRGLVPMTAGQADCWPTRQPRRSAARGRSSVIADGKLNLRKCFAKVSTPDPIRRDP